MDLHLRQRREGVHHRRGEARATLKRLRSGTTHTFTAIYGEFTDDPKFAG
ncbi:hypothetical protein ABN028_24285 [Actinopolymorpha sp. B17G11]